MRKIGAFLVAIIVTLAGCMPERNPLWLAVGVDKTTVALDDSIEVTLTLTNTGDREVMVYPASAYGRCRTGFEVIDGVGRPVIMTVTCPTDDVAKVPLVPGTSIDAKTWWIPGISTSDNLAIEPGLYYLSGAVQGDNRVMRTNPFIITVTE